MADIEATSETSGLPEVTDEHTLYIFTSTATAQQVQAAIVTALTGYQVDHDPNFKYELRINRVENRDLQPLGFCYVYISNSAGFHLLLDRNPDGTERFEKDDTKLIKLPSLVEVPPVQLADGEYELTFREAVAPALDDQQYMTNVLRCSNVPPWVSEHTILERIILRPQGNGYPRVAIDRKKRMAYIMYQSKTDDARMALCMIRKVRIVLRGERGRTNEVTLMFGHALRSEGRDIRSYKYVR